MTSEECLNNAKDVETLAKLVSFMPDKLQLLEAADHWRLLATLADP